MTVKRIVKVYFDLPHYVKPKEVGKIFRLMDKRREKLREIEDAFRETTKEHLRNEFVLFEGEFNQLLNLVTPKHCNWNVTAMTTSSEKCWMLVITEPVNDELNFKGQDE